MWKDGGRWNEYLFLQKEIRSQEKNSQSYNRAKNRENGDYADIKEEEIRRRENEKKRKQRTYER